jgi:DNA-binding IclR family transcriptional regulator
MIDHDISRGRNNPASQAAFERSAPMHKSQRQRILEMIEGSDGLTSKEIAQRTGWPLHAFSGRITSLKASELIRGTGEYRYGAEVLVSTHEPKQANFWTEVA